MGQDAPLVAIVDDDCSVRRAVGRLVRSLGLKADTYASGEDLLATLDETVPHPPDCLILDVQMPGLSGFEVQARVSAANYRIPIVFITGHEADETSEKARAGGAIGLLRKPFDDTALVEMIHRALAHRSGSGVSAWDLGPIGEADRGG